MINKQMFSLEIRPNPSKERLFAKANKALKAKIFNEFFDSLEEKSIVNLNVEA